MVRRVWVLSSQRTEGKCILGMGKIERLEDFMNDILKSQGHLHLYVSTSRGWLGSSDQAIVPLELAGRDHPHFADQSTQLHLLSCSVREAARADAVSKHS